MKITIDIACESVCVEGAITQIQQAQSREDVKSGSLTVGYEKLDSYIKDVGETDQTVSFVVSGSKRDFYKAYSYLKPECEKSRGEKIKDFFCAAWDIICDVAVALCDFVLNIGSWIKEHWVILVVSLVIIVLAAVLTVLTGGGGLALIPVLLAIAKGIGTAILAGFISGAIGAGIASYQCRKNNIPREYARGYIAQAFGDGMSTGILMGAIGFGVGALVNCGASALLTHVPKLGSFFVAHSLGGAIAKGALYGAITSGTTGAITSGIGYFIQNGTNGSVKGFFKTVLIGGGLSATLGAVTGGFGGARQYLKTQSMDNAFNTENLDRTARGDQKAWKTKDGINQGDNYENYANMRQSTTRPGMDVKTQARIENSDFAASQKAAGLKGQTMRADQVVLKPNGQIDSILELKSSPTAPHTLGQTNYGVSDLPSSALSMDAVVSGNGITPQTMPAGTSIPTVRPENFTQQIGVNVTGSVSPTYRTYFFEGSEGITSQNFTNVLSAIQNPSSMTTGVHFLTDFSVGSTVISSAVTASEGE